MTNLRAKFYVETVATHPTHTEVELRPVTSGSEENKSFSQYTPSGSLKLTITNPDALGYFVAGKEYYIDFSDATVDAEVENVEAETHVTAEGVQPSAEAADAPTAQEAPVGTAEGVQATEGDTTPVTPIATAEGENNGTSEVSTTTTETAIEQPVATSEDETPATAEAVIAPEVVNTDAAVATPTVENTTAETAEQVNPPTHESTI